MFRALLLSALVAFAVADKVYQCKSTYQESGAPSCSGYEWPSDYRQMCTLDDITKGEESTYFTVADNVVPMCYTWVLRYDAREFVPGEIAKRQAMYLWRGANMQAQRKTCENACKDVRNYIYSLGDEYKSVYFSCSYMEDGNNESVKNHMLSLTNPTGTACGNDNEYAKPTGDKVPPQEQVIATPEPAEADWAQMIMIVQIVLIVLALVLVVAGAIVLFLFKSVMSSD